MSITIKEIAQIAGVSKTTVSKVLNGKDESISEVTKNKIKEIMKENNYVRNKLAQSLVTKKTNMIGLIIPDIRNPFFTDISRGIEDQAYKNGYNIILCNTDENIEKEKEVITKLLEIMVDGIIIVTSSNTNPQDTDYDNVNIPTVTIDKNIGVGNLKGTVNLDNFEGGYVATKKLLENGNEKILYISGPLKNQIAIDRLDGYKKALLDYGLSEESSIVVEGKYNIDWAYNYIQSIACIDFDAVFCGNDLIAIGVIKSLQNRGYNVPSSIEVIGFDDIQISSLISPSISTISQPSYQMGFKACEILIKNLDNSKGQIDSVIFRPLLIERESTKKV